MPYFLWLPAKLLAVGASVGALFLFLLCPGGILIALVILLVFLLEDKSDLYTRLEEEQSVTWLQVKLLVTSTVYTRLEEEQSVT